ncbi:MAG: sensor histidine kinase [Deltaproteobacteria bacterium]|nr:MAG: sensor histidine kinase [Deltaproteobacteria bacterium]
MGSHPLSSAPLSTLPRPVPEPEDLERLRSLAELGSVSASLLHELRQPIFALQSYLYLLERSGDLGDGLAEHVRYLQSLVEFYTSFLDVAHPVQTLDLRTEIGAVRPVLERQARQQKIRLSFLLPEEPVQIRARPAAPRQVVANLVRNAIEASSQASAPMVEIAVGRRASWATLAVRDRGPGVEPADRSRIFEPWFSTKGAEGTGLGLHLSRRLVQAEGGELQVTDNPGGGALFEVRWPLLQLSPAGEPEPAPK